MGKILYETDFALLTFTKENKLLELNWLKSCTKEEYQAVFNTAIDIASKNKINFFLSDIRNGGAVSVLNLQWLKENVVPKAFNLGIQKIGIILNEELFKKIYADSVKNSVLRNKISINYFSKREDALTWFSS